MVQKGNCGGTRWASTHRRREDTPPHWRCKLVGAVVEAAHGQGLLTSWTLAPSSALQVAALFEVADPRTGSLGGYRPSPSSAHIESIFAARAANTDSVCDLLDGRGPRQDRSQLGRAPPSVRPISESQWVPLVPRDAVRQPIILRLASACASGPPFLQPAGGPQAPISGCRQLPDASPL